MKTTKIEYHVCARKLVDAGNWKYGMVADDLTKAIATVVKLTRIERNEPEKTRRVWRVEQVITTTQSDVIY